MTFTAQGAPDQVCTEIRAAIRDNEELTPRERGHLDAVAERLVHARSQGKDFVSVTLEITQDLFSFRLQ